jgi:hypothetical protein
VFAGVPSTVTTPSFTVTVNRFGSMRNSSRITSLVISARMSLSERSKTDSTSARLMMPTSGRLR